MNIKNFKSSTKKRFNVIAIFSTVIIILSEAIINNEIKTFKFTDRYFMNNFEKNKN